MAGSGKTTLIQRINAYLHTKQSPVYIINLDPAVLHLPYGANIDIRDTVKYKNVMKQYNLGPNGGILTSCNLFATRFDQVIGLLEKPREPPLRHVVVDTPGQIEIFTWSASGAIVTELLATSFPTAVLFVADTPRCAAPQTFMATMLQACSIMYKTQLPMVVAFNKVDVAQHGFATSWLSDVEVLSAALDTEQSYGATLSRSLAFALEPFYEGLRCVGVSALTGQGMDELFQAVDSCREEYFTHYVPELEARKLRKEEREERRRKVDMERLQRDLAGASLSQRTEQPGAGLAMGSRPGPGPAASRLPGLDPVPGYGRGKVDVDMKEEEEEEDFDYHVTDSEIEESGDDGEGDLAKT